MCEKYFVPVVEELATSWNISDDVTGISTPLILSHTALTHKSSNAGSTLLAIGTSSTELFTALIGLFRSEREDPGPGTIIGAACFNTTLLIAASALAVQKPFWGYFTATDTTSTSSTLTVRVWPLLRNSFFYAAAMILLLVFYTVITPNQIDL